MLLLWDSFCSYFLLNKLKILMEVLLFVCCQLVLIRSKMRCHETVVSEFLLKWSSVKGIAVIESKRIIGNKESIARRYYITNHPSKDAKFINQTVRSHWSVENNLHWQLDVSFDEDNCRLRSGNAAANFSFLNKVAISPDQKWENRQDGHKI